MKKLSLRKLYESESIPDGQFSQPATKMDKNSFLESLRRFSEYKSSIYGSKNLLKISEEVRDLIESAEQIALTETEEWFDNVTVNRHMKQLKESYKTFDKTIKEITQLQQRLEACYEDIGKNLNNYWDL